MKKIMLLVALVTALFMGCSKDDDDAKPKCESCTSEQGTKHEICDNGDGTYDYYLDGDKQGTLTEEELLEFSPKEFVELACEAELGL